MKKTILGAALLAALAGPAFAADMPPRPYAKAPAYTAPALVYNWTGFYIGINGGGGWGTSRWDSTGDFDLSGGLVGGTVGYNWQTGALVFGLEGDIDWSNIKGRTSVLCPAGCETRNSWLGTARGRLGFAADRFMPYVTGGLAFGDIQARVPFLPGRTDTNTGWTVGGGVEYAFANNWTAKAEYLYVDLGKINCGIACGALTTDDVTFKTHIVRGGLNFRF